MLVLIGASASGKTEVAKILIRDFGYTKIITNTTREKRQGEINDVDYHFISEKDFLEKKENDYFIETALYDNHYYGTAFKDVKKNTVLIVEPNGANNIIKANIKNTYIVFFDASESTRIKRMKERGDRKDKIEKRIIGDRNLFQVSSVDRVDYIVDTNIKNQYDIALEVHQIYQKEISND